MHPYIMRLIHELNKFCEEIMNGSNNDSYFACNMIFSDKELFHNWGRKP